MKVFVTGGTGFIGAHTARALMAAGHEVRLLVRNPSGVAEYFARFGLRPDDLAIADMRNAAAVRAAMAGCDAVFHAAALVSVDPRHGAGMLDGNLDGVRSVLGGAVDLGIGRIVHVSSLSVLAAKGGAGLLDEEAPLADPVQPYARSKRACEDYVRGLQARGAPVRIVYPAATMGPDDPRLCESMGGLRGFLSRVPITSTGLQVVDVRDLALAHRLLLERAPAGSPQGWRYVAAGHYHGWPDLHALLSGLVGRRIPSAAVPGALLRALGGVSDLLRPLLPMPHALSREAMHYVTRWRPADSSRLLAETGLRFRPGEETLGDAIRWLVLAGHIDAGAAGVLAPA